MAYINFKLYVCVFFSINKYDYNRHSITPFQIKMVLRKVNSHDSSLATRNHLASNYSINCSGRHTTYSRTLRNAFKSNLSMKSLATWTNIPYANLFSIVSLITYLIDTMTIFCISINCPWWLIVISLCCTSAKVLTLSALINPCNFGALCKP